MSDDTMVDQAWRVEMLEDLASGDAARSTRALLSLTYNDPDRTWVEDLLSAQLQKRNDPQLCALAVTCVGHLGRMHGLVSSRLVTRLEGLLGDPVVGGIAEDALGDVRHFAKVL
ncbi:hypothetical protein [Amycolatopsis samaneae]|uniref:HEAT repeat domain-containing protein n=1 Tax=Amycolatopsis samaneae TaxID=664691 RepID=A0ABW5G7W0_9PSEU